MFPARTWQEAGKHSAYEVTLSKSAFLTSLAARLWAGLTPEFGGVGSTGM